MSNNDDSLGRLKHTTKDDCDECGEAKLQLRVRNVGGKDEEYLYCPRCEFEKRPKRSKQEGIWKKQVTKEVEVVEVDVKNILQNWRRKQGNGKDSREGDRKSGERNPKRFPK